MVAFGTESEFSIRGLKYKEINTEKVNDPLLYIYLKNIFYIE